MFNVQSDLNPLAEAWVLSCHPDGPSVLADGPLAGTTLPDYLAEAGAAALGTNCARFEKFPMLIKLIDAKEDLSIQVHPPDAYALAHMGQYGKTEMWIALKAEPDAFLYYGFRREISREEFTKRIFDGTLTEVLRKVPVQEGDVLFIPAGTIHSIAKGLVVAEIQQNSDVTYRIYDYGRVGADGKPRSLHIAKAIEVTQRHPVAVQTFETHLGSCPYFTADGHSGPFIGQCGNDSFHALLVTEGEGVLCCGREKKRFKEDIVISFRRGAEHTG